MHAMLDPMTLFSEESSVVFVYYHGPLLVTLFNLYALLPVKMLLTLLLLYFQGKT